MSPRSRIALVVVAIVAVIAAAGFVAWRWGVLQFTQGSFMPTVSLARLLNPEPSLDRPINFPSDFTPEAQKLFNAELAKTKAALEKDPSDVSAWFDLAIEYRMVNDNAGAVQIWKYVSANYPNNGVSLHNLGQYYFYTAKDYQTAESYYLRSIAVAPELEQNYLDLADLYEYNYKQSTSDAADILKEGIRNIGAPENIDLYTRLGKYYADTNDAADARAAYTQARDEARAAGNTKLVQQLDKTISQLGK